MSSKRKARAEKPKAPETPAGAGPATPPDAVRRRDLAVLSAAFLAGAVLMAMEIVGGRIVAAHFGSHVFVWGGLIGIFMGALSLGYYVGGRTADRHPDIGFLAGVMVLAGCAVLLVPLVADPLCRFVGGVLFTGNMELANRWNPTVAVILVFAVPSVLLGSISPFAVRLLARDIETMGRVTARVYAFNALGSIIGTLVTAFFLMSYMGNRMILISLAVLFAGAGAALFRIGKVWKAEEGSPSPEGAGAVST